MKTKARLVSYNLRSLSTMNKKIHVMMERSQDIDKYHASILLKLANAFSTSLNDLKDMQMILSESKVTREQRLKKEISDLKSALDSLKKEKSW